MPLVQPSFSPGTVPGGGGNGVGPLLGLVTAFALQQGRYSPGKRFACAVKGQAFQLRLSGFGQFDWKGT